VLALRALPAEPGVYRFRDPRGRTLYIGRAVDLRRRVASYWGDLRDRAHLRRMVPRIDRVEAVWCDSEHEAAFLERNLLESSTPPWNRTTGVESIVYIGLSRELEVRHEPGIAPAFGPYLGGDKVRLAVSGLNRALPLAYAGEGLGGFDRDMARLRRIEPGSRPVLMALATAVLSRDVAAVAQVRKELTTRRDGAVSVLAFELAARIHEELAALDWVLAPQKVTQVDGDADIRGWADGVLVSFELRGGRIRVWRARPCSERSAPALVAATPAPWRAFADRNAALAARLAAPPA
jgi:excinuclease ABC subunit C